MDRRESSKARITRVAREVSRSLRTQARGRWDRVRTAERNEPGRHVWRFRDGPADAERFLHIEHRAMVTGPDPAKRLLAQLADARWLDRLQGESALILSRDGQLAAYPLS